jgi:signal transduction histidine kinase
MAELITLLQNLVAIAFAALGVATAIQWLRHRDPSLGWLALAIIALSIVSSIGRVQPWLGFVAPVIPYLSLAAFMGSGYALLRYRDSIIPIDPRWLRVATAAVLIAFALGAVITTPGVARGFPPGARLALVLPLVVVWAAFVGETAIRFWLVSRSLPVVTRWRLRSLSLGFAGLILIIVFAIGASAILKTAAAQIIVELAVLAIIPLLYVSFSPPGWLRRQWRSSEEEDLKRFMEDLLLLGEEPASLQEQVLDWALRLVGGQSALVVRADGTVDARGIDSAEVDHLALTLEQMADGLRPIVVGGMTKPALLLTTPAIDGASRVLLIAGPFTPALGSDEMRRAQQFVSATTAALDRVRLVKRLQVANNQLQEANEHKSVFLANMSHELRTPLNAILGFSELLIDDVGQQRVDSATGLSFLEQIHTSGQHLLGLINDILDLSKIEAGQMELRLEVVEVDQIINQAVTMVEPLADKKQIRLEAARGGGRLLADSAKLHQMLLNLLSNAIKFTPQGGLVEIAVESLSDTLQIDVRDSGIGIATADQERIFGEFQQVDSSVARQQTGTGLGLTLTRRFALLHNGSLTVRS